MGCRALSLCVSHAQRKWTLEGIRATEGKVALAEGWEREQGRMERPERGMCSNLKDNICDMHTQNNLV